MLPNYRPAKLYQGPTHWYVYYYFLNSTTLKYHRFKEHFDINRIKSKNEKLQYGKCMVEFLNQKLASGFNPFLSGKSSGNFVGRGIIYQLNYVLEIMCLNQTDVTITTYTTMYNRIVGFLEKNNLRSISLLQFDVDLSERFKQYMVDKKLSKKTINTTLSHLGMFWDVAVDKKLCFENPLRKTVKIKKSNTKASDDDIFEPLTSDEVKNIFSTLDATGQWRYKTFLCFIYLAWARPVEITRLKVSDVSLMDEHIKFKKGKTKNSRGAYVQIVPKLKELLLKMNLHKYPGDYYLFGTDYKPSDTKIYYKGIGKLWTAIVKEKLEIDKTMYALKHTGNIEYLQNNKGKVDLKWQQSQNRHSSAAMTERYNRKLGAYFIDTSEVKLGNF